MTTSGIRTAPRRVPAGLLVLVALPPLALAAIGTLHPQGLNNADALLWRNIHFAGLFLFPFLGVTPWLLIRARSRSLAVVVAVLGYVFAAGYTALDVLAGIGAGSLQMAGLGGERALYNPADVLGRIGTIAYLIATVLAVGVLLWHDRRPGLTLLGGVLVIAGAVSFITSHIYPPRGVVTMIVLAVGWGLLLLVSRHPAPGERSGVRHDG